MRTGVFSKHVIDSIGWYFSSNWGLGCSLVRILLSTDLSKTTYIHAGLASEKNSPSIESRHAQTHHTRSHHAKKRKKRGCEYTRLASFDHLRIKHTGITRCWVAFKGVFAEKDSADKWISLMIIGSCLGILYYTQSQQRILRKGQTQSPHLISDPLQKWHPKYTLKRTVHRYPDRYNL